MSSTVQSFVANKARQSYHLDPDTAWTSAITKFGAPNASQTVQVRTSRFSKFHHLFLSSTKENALRKFLSRTHYSIQDVQSEVNAAIDEYERQGSSFRAHFFRTAGRSYSNNASTIEGLLNFLPSGDYGSVLCGVLTLVFNGAKRLSKVREKILNTLSGLTNAVEDTKAFMALYTGDLKLWQLAEDLYICLLDGTEIMMGWLDQSAYRHASGAIFKQDDYAKPIEDKQHSIESKVQAFRQHLEYCQHQRISKIQINQDKILVEVQDLSADQKTIIKNQDSLIQMTMKMCEGLQRHAHWQMQEHRQNKEALREVVSKLSGLERQPYIVFGPGPGSFVSSSQLVDVLGVDVSSPAADLTWVLQQTPSSIRQSRTANILQSEQFQSWCQTGECEILVINGRDADGARTAMSSTAYLAALFARSIGESQSAIPLTFFCGQHATPEDQLEGASGMMAGLIVQLISCFGDALDLSFINYGYLEVIRSRDVRALCDLFQKILVCVMNLGRPSPIICLIDGVALLETKARRPDLEVAIEALQQLVVDLNALGGFMIFKVLLLYPYMSRFAYVWFPKEMVLTMSE